MAYNRETDLESIQADVLGTDTSTNTQLTSLKQLKTDTKTPTKAINALNEQLGNAQTSASDAVARVVQLEQTVADLQTIITTLQAQLAADDDAFLQRNFVYIYPNGGTAEQPATVTANTRYIEAHPFPGYHVHCVPEVMVNNKWGETGWIYNSSADKGEGGGYGIKAGEYDGNIVIQTGAKTLMAYSFNDGNPFGNNMPSTSTATLPCRVKVWKVGRMEADE